YLVFFLLCVFAIGICLGLFYRFSAIGFLLLFTYVELLDKTFYLNHYYLVTLLTFWSVFVPANRWFSVDAVWFPKLRSDRCSNWHILIFKVQLSIVYFFAGLAKVNPDWIYRAQPLATWLPGRYELPLIGKYLHLKEVAYFFSWAGCAYDLTIWIFLWIKKTRGLAYVGVLFFHILTGILFPRIGMFPFIMITSTVIFFSSEWHERVLGYLTKVIKWDGNKSPNPSPNTSIPRNHSKLKLVTIFLASYVLVQLYLPFRHLQYPGNLFWNERGYRFSWRVMLMEKNGYTTFILRDPVKEIQKEVDVDEYLTPFQQQQMRSQPDMIVQFAKHIGDEFLEDKGYAPQVFVESRISLNARRSQPFTNDTLDVYALPNPINSNWIIPLKK
ncbi:MAG: HTTM domain-containing protein, partial [Bacteroidota bacterium]